MSKNPWIRSYRDALHNPKIVTLNDRQFRTWQNCLWMADDTGELPKMRDIACHLRMSLNDAEQVICDLIEAGLVDVDNMAPARRLTMHDWHIYQYTSDNSTERVRKHREKLKQNKASKDETFHRVTRNVSVTPPESESESEEESSGSSTSRVAAKAKTGGIDSGFGKGKIEEGIVARARQLDVPVDALLAVMQAPRRTKIGKPAGYFVKCCIEHLREKIPARKISDETINNAIYWGDFDAMKELTSALCEVV